MKNFLYPLFFSAMMWLSLNITAQNADTASFPYWIGMMQQEDVNFFVTRKAFETFWKDRPVTRGNGYKPFKRWEYMMQQRVDAQGRRPAADRELKAYYKTMASGKVLKNPAGSWSPLGPFTVPSGYNGYRGLGRINAIGFDPINADVLYIGAPAGGLWVSYNHGSSWQVLTDHLPTLGVSSILVDRTNANTILIGTGDRDAGDAPGMGIWRTTDGGINWQQWSNGIGNATVGRLLQDALDPLVMFAASSNGLYRTNDAGATWTRVRTGNFKEVVQHPSDPQIVYAASGGNFFRSQDNGQNFQLISNGLPGGSRAVIGVSAADPNVVYCLQTTSDAFKGIYRSTDAGLSFEERSISPNIMSWDCNGGDGGQAWYDLDIAVDPMNADNILAGGVNSFRSLDGGSSWTIRSHWYGGCGVQSVHADLHVLEYNPLNNRLYVGNDGGFYWTSNGGVNWTEITNGLVISQAYKIGQSQTKPNHVINGYQDNGSSAMNETIWLAVGGGDGMECAYDPTDYRYSYSSIYYGAIERQFNNVGQGSIAGEGTNGITESGGWVTPYLVDHKDGNTMFIGYKNVWRSKNIKASSTGNVQWQKISSFGNNNLEQMVQSEVNTNILYVSAGNKLFMTDNASDGTVTWTSRTSQLPSSSTITAIATDPSEENVVYLAQQTKIFRSADKGLSWTEISANLSDIQINSIACYRNSAGGLYIGTDIGIFYKEPQMNEWMYFSEGLPASVKVTEIEIFYDPVSPASDLLRAGTYGRGLWGATPYFGTLTADFVVSDNSIAAGCTVSFTDKTAGTPYTWEWTFEGATPQTSTLQNPTDISYPNEGVFDVSLTVTNPNGSHTYTIENCVVVGPSALPEVDFQASNTVGCEDMVVEFTDMTDNCPNLWIWDITPGTFSYLQGTNNLTQNPVVQFNEYGHYNVRLTATNANGVGTLLKTSLIHVGGEGLNFSENFEDTDILSRGWSIQNPDNGKTWALKTLSSGNGTAWMNFFNYTAFNQRDYLITPPMDWTGMDEVKLSFEYAYVQRYAQIDSLIVSVSTDCGNSWQRVYANGPDGMGGFETAPPMVTSFEPASMNEWCVGDMDWAGCPLIDLNQYTDMKGVKIRFESFNQYGNNLYLDNVFVSALLTAPENEKKSQLLYLYPNPAKKKVFIQMEDDFDGKQLIITDIWGKIIRKQNISQTNFEVSLEGIATGLYTVQIMGTDVSQRLVIQ